MTRIGTPAAALLALALLTAGCSGGSSEAKDTAPTSAQATAAAKAINLTKKDVAADLEASDHDSTDDASDKELQKGVATCVGVDPAVLDDANQVVDENSQDFSKGQPPSGYQVSSDVSVVKTKDIAKKQFAVFQSSKASDCLIQAFDKQFKKELGSEPGATLGKVTIKKLDVDKSGTDAAFAFEVSLPISGGGISLDLKASIYGFLVKHTEVTLTSTSFGTGVPDDVVKGLYGKLVERAKKSAV